MEYSTSEISSRFISAAYQLLEKIGEGGFGHVYKAKHVTTGQTVAIKFLTLSPEFDVEKKRRYIDRFERETELVSRLKHPNVVRLLDKGRDDDERLYAVFEYVEGLTLKNMLRESGALSPLETADVMAQVLDALVHAHEKGVIHRDLKPANIMLSKVGAKTHAKILDFGIGSLTKEARQLEYKTITLTQETLGTPSYSAPEQLRGEPPTPKTDLYVWGLVFLECLTGQPAISGGSLASIFHKQLSPSNVPLPPAVAGHPVAELLRRVLNKKSYERVANAEDVYRELKEINFSTLVGNLQLPTQAVKANPQSCLGFINDETIINDTGLLYTGLVEKKQITVLAVNVAIQFLVEEQGDFEISDSLQRDLQNQCIDIAIRYGAFHAGTLAGNMVFYFGYPVVSDNDSRLCARTALEISSSINQKNPLLKQAQGCEILVRMGMNTGAVMTYADAIPDGETISFSMQLAYEALPKQVLCSDSSKTLLDNYIEFKPDEAKTLGTYQRESVRHVLVGERIVEALGFLRGNCSNYEFVGREKELGGLLALLDVNSKISTAHVYGEAGIGKSRLIYELRNRAKGIQSTIAQCLPEHEHNALSPIFDVLKRKYSLDVLNPESAINSLRNALSANGKTDLSLSLPLLCAWLHLPFSGSDEAVILPPEIQKDIIFEALIMLLVKEGSAVDQGERSLFIIEDLHWADPTSIEFIAYLLKHPLITNRNAVFISTSRKVLPGNIASVDQPSLEITGLTESQIRTFIASLFDKKEVSKDVLEVVISRTDGIPLFIEELVNMLQHKKLVKHLNGIVDLVNPDELDGVPQTLLDSLQQNLDTLVDSTKETVQLAATIGREFDYALLAAATNSSEENLQCDLKELLEGGLVYQRRQTVGDSYIFKHALVRDVAYNNASKSKKCEFHKYIANSIKVEFPDKAKSNPLVLAQHFKNAECYTDTVEWATKYIDHLSKLSLNQEVINYSTTIGTWLENKSNHNPLSCVHKVLLNHSILPAYTKQIGWGNPMLEELSEGNLAFIEMYQNDEGKIPKNLNLDVDIIRNKSQWTLLAFNHYQGNRKKARKIGEALYEAALSAGDRINIIMVGVILGQAYFFDGNLDKAKFILLNVLDCHDSEKDIDLNVEFGLDPHMMAAGNLMSIAAVSGQLDEGEKYKKQCLQHALKTNNKAMIVTAYTFGSCFYAITNNREGMREWCEGARESSLEVFNGEWVEHFFIMNESWPKSEYERSLHFIQEDVESGQTGFLHWYEPAVARSLIANDNYKAAYRLMLDSYERVRDSGDVCMISMTLNVLGIAKYYCDGYLSEESKKFHYLAISTAQNINASMFELISRCELAECINSDACSSSYGRSYCSPQEKMDNLKGIRCLLDLEGVEYSEFWEARALELILENGIDGKSGSETGR